MGPFGYAHQHEDKLKFLLTAYRRHFIVEGGFFTYDSSQWRTYVLGPYAHNVAFADGVGQNRCIRRETFVTDKPSDFIWELTPEYEFAQGYCCGESEGFGPNAEWIATHRRSILFVKEGRNRDFW